MKNLLLALLFVGLGGWYCYDKYGDKIFPKIGQTEKVDPRAAALEKRALELFPTKKAQREKWIADQTAAMGKLALSERRKGISAAEGKKIRAAAAKKFPDDYEKRLSYVRGRENSALELARTVRNLDLSPEEISAITESAEKLYGDNYDAQIAAIARLGETLTAVKQKWNDVPPSDYATVLARALAICENDPAEAAKFVDRQLLARHNFREKSIPAQFGDLRKGIETAFPNDFCAQLAELDKRLDAAIRKGERAETRIASKQLENIFYSDIKIAAIGERYFCTYLMDLDGKKALLFPAELLEFFKADTKTLEVAGFEVDADKIFVSPHSMFAFAVVDAPADEKTAQIAQSAVPLEDRRVAIIGVNRHGGQAFFYPKISDGKFELTAADTAQVDALVSGGAAVADVKTGEIVGLAELSPTFGSEFYKDLSQAVMARSAIQMPSAMTIIAKVAQTAKSRRSVKLAFFDKSDMRLWRKFDVPEYAAQLAAAQKLSYLNYWGMRFVRNNTFDDARRSKVFAGLAENNAQMFLDGGRMHKNLFVSRYSRYLSDAAALFARETAKADTATQQPYYRFVRPLAAQREIAAEIAEYLKTAKVAATNAYIHADLAFKIQKDSYNPKLKLSKEQMAELLGN